MRATALAPALALCTLLACSGPNLEVTVPPDPSADGAAGATGAGSDNLTGIWVGWGAMQDRTEFVVLFFEHRGREVGGAAFHLGLSFFDFDLGDIPDNLEPDDLPWLSDPSAPGRRRCDIEGGVADGIVSLRVPGSQGHDLLARLVSSEGTLTGRWGVDTNLADISGDLVLYRIAWLPFERPETDARACLPGPLPRCSDGIDNDGDGLIDGDDPACARDPLLGERGDPPCRDGLDNDGDGLVDAADWDCPGAESAGAPPACADGRDNDLDGKIDLADPGCGGQPDGWREVAGQCEDDLDNDRDGLTDDADPDCATGDAEDPALGPCENGYDDDGDGLIDEDDPVCALDRPDPHETASSTCADALDNDGDGLVDRDDPECAGDLWGREAWYFRWGIVPAADSLYHYCENGLDDDGDGRVDGDDPDCGVWLSRFGPARRAAGPRRNLESQPQCLDGADNDGDGLADLQDPDCDSLLDASERPDCENGLDDDGDGLVDQDDPTCLAHPRGPEARPACSDGVDNDGDGRVDAADPHCLSPADELETSACTDRIDNDGDGLFDHADPGCDGPDDDLED